MNAIFRLDTVIDGIAKKLNTKAHKDSLLGQDYMLPNVTEEQLIEIGFEFIGYDSQHRYPMYRYENLEGYFNQTVFYLYEVTR